MKQVFCIVLICSLFAQSSVRLVWGMYYQYNKDVFARNCENKSKPALCCQGKCQLRKVLIENIPVTTKSPAIPAGLLHMKDLQVFIEPLLFYRLGAPGQAEQAILPVFIFSLPAAPSFSNFKPPSGTA